MQSAKFAQKPSRTAVTPDTEVAAVLTKFAHNYCEINARDLGVYSKRHCIRVSEL